MESFIEKVSFEKVSSTKSRVLWSLVNSYQWFEKCFSLPAIGTLRTLFEKNNLFINGWTFSNFHFKPISGTELMLKKVLLERRMFTISLLTCFRLLIKPAATIMKFSVIWSSVSGEKNLGGFQGLHGKGFLESAKISLVSLLDFVISATCFVNFFPNSSRSCFCKRTAFSFNILFTWYCKFMIHPKTLNLLWYVMAFLLCPRGNICWT